MTKIARVQNKIRRLGQGVNLGNRFLQRSDHIFVSFFIESDVAVADLRKGEIPAGKVRRGAEDFRCQDAAAYRPKDSGACPSHAFEKAATIDAVRIVIV